MLHADLVVVRDRGPADVVAEVIGALHRLAGVQLGGLPFRERVLSPDLAAELEGDHHRVEVGLAAQVAGSISGSASGSAEASRSDPRLAGRTTPPMSVKPSGGPAIPASSR